MTELIEIDGLNADLDVVEDVVEVIESADQGPPGAAGLIWIDAGWSVDLLVAVRSAVTHDGSSYRCTVPHTASAATEPGVGADWQTVWTLLAKQGDPGAGLAVAQQAALDANPALSAEDPVAAMSDVAAAAGPAETLASIGTLISEAGGVESPSAGDHFTLRDSITGFLAKISPANFIAWLGQTFVGKEAGKSLVADTEIAKIHEPNSDNQDLSGLVPKQSGVILGQKDARTDLSPADGATATLDCSLGNAFKITAPDSGAGMDFVIALSNVPAGAVTFAIEVCIIVGTNIPTISLTNKGANVTLPTLTASRKNVWIISTWDNGTTLQVNDAGKF